MHTVPVRGGGRVSRRALLGALGASSGLAGLGLAATVNGRDRVKVLAAASLAAAFEEGIGPAFEDEHGIRFDGEYHGSNAIVRLVESGTKHPDVVVSVDVGLLRDRLRPAYAEWDLEFAAGEVGIAYDPETALGARLADGEPWYEAFTDAAGGEIAIADPDLTPIGYRAVQLFELAEGVHGLDGFREELLERARIERGELQLLAGVDAGNRACAVCYRNMAIDHDLSFLALPDAYNFADPSGADRYAEASYTTDEGYTVTGSPVVYTVTVPTAADEPGHGEAFVGFLTSASALLEERGLGVPEPLPRADGSVPKRLQP